MAMPWPHETAFGWRGCFYAVEGRRELRNGWWIGSARLCHAACRCGVPIDKPLRGVS